MNKVIFIIGLIALVVLAGLYAKRTFYDPKHILENAKKEEKRLAAQGDLKDGDLIFQTSMSAQSKAIQLATKSKYSHCGLIYKDGNGFYVFECELLKTVKTNE